MSASIGFRLPRGGGTALLALAVVLGVGSAGAQPPRDGSDLLDQARRLKEVAAQKVEAEVRDALRQAQAPADPARAAARLRQVLAAVEQDTALSAERRAALRQAIENRLRALGAAGQPGDNAGRQIQEINRTADERARTLEQEQVNQGLAAIRKLQSEGRFAEASRVAADLARQYPNNPAAQAAARISPAADRAVDLRNLRIEREHRLTGAFGQAEAAAIPPAGDMDFPPDWKEKTQRRSKFLVKMTDKERAILEALNSPVSIVTKGGRFEDVIKELERISGQPILLDQPSLDEAQVTYETPVNVQLRNVTFRTALRKVLADLGLTYVVKDQAIQVMTPVRAKELMSVRAYYIGDLLFTAGITLPPALSQLQMAQAVVQLIDLIQRTVDPPSWQVNGGLGTITFHAPTMSLVIKQSAEMHLILGGGLGSYAP